MTAASATRERILAEARQLFAEKGFDGATTAEIARRAGIAEGTIYRYFRDKKELFIACVAPAVEEGIDRELAEVLKAKDLRGLVRSMLEARVRLVSENLASFNILFTEAPYHPELVDMLFSGVILARLEKAVPLLRRLTESGELRRPPDILRLSLALTAAIWAILNFSDRLDAIAARFPVPSPPGDVLDDITDLFLYGIAGGRVGPDGAAGS